MFKEILKKWKRKRIEKEIRKSHPDISPAQLNDIMNRIVSPLLNGKKIGSTSTRNRK